jgi:hypothetical protein
MAEWAAQPGGARVLWFSAYTSGDGIINSSASANTKGSYEAVATTTFDIDSFIVNFAPNTQLSRDFLCDVSVGAGGSEQIILSNLLYSGSVLLEYAPYHFPLHIPSGSVIRARTQCSTGTSAHELFFHGFTSSFDGQPACTRVETLGANTADSGGTSIDPGGTTGVLGTWQQVVATTSFDYRYLIVAFGNQANATRSSMQGDLDIAIGAAASEQLILSGLRYGTTTGDDCINPHVYPTFPVAIKAGSRISARTVNYSINSSPARLIDIVLYGIG